MVEGSRHPSSLLHRRLQSAATDLDLQQREVSAMGINYETRDHRYIMGFKGYRRGMARLYCVKLLQPTEES